MKKRIATLYVAAASVAASAHAQEGTDTATDPNDIIVTARRVEERLQDVPASLTVFSQKSIEQKNIRSVLDLATFTPSLSVDGRFGAKAARFSIRGFSQASRTASTIGVYFADVVAPRAGNNSNPAGDGSGPGTLFDLENVQVLNGPQGTLFGRNTTGGAVIITPRKPTDRFEGYVEASYGNYDSKRLQAVLNLPISDGVRLRLGTDALDADGYLDNISGVGADRYGDQAYLALRASLLVDLSPEIQNYTIATYSITEDHGPMPKLTACNPAPTRPGTFSFAVQSCEQIARAAGRDFYTVEGARADPYSRGIQWVVINTLSWKISDAVTFRNILSYSQVRTNQVMDPLGANFIIPPNTYGNRTGRTLNFGFSESTRAPGYNNTDQQNVVVENRLQGSAFDNRLDWQAGLYFEHSTPRRSSGTQAPNTIYCTNSDAFQCTDLVGSGLATPRATGFLGNQIGRVSLLNRAIYGQATYRLLDALKITGGLRYTWDRTRGYGQLIAYDFSDASGAPLPTPVKRCTLGNTVSLADNCRTDRMQSSEAPTWTIGVDYDPAEDILLYAKYSRGYRQGIISFNVPPTLQAVGPEKIDSYEVGAKTGWRGLVPGTFNIAGFYNDLQNQQININVSNSQRLTTSTSANLNAGKSEIYGFEAEGSLRPTPDLTLSGNVAYLHTQVKSLPRPDIPSIYDTVVPAARVGGPLPFAPKWKWNLSGSYQLPVAEDVGRVSVSTTFTRTTSFVYVTGVNGTIDGTGLLSANLNWEGVFGTPVDLSLYGTNLTAEKYYTGVNDLLGSGGFVSKFIGEPRMYGIRIRYSFGR